MEGQVFRPRTISDLSDVPEDERDGYIPAGDGTFKLHPVLAEDCDRYEAELAALDAKSRRTEAELERLIVRGEIRAVLERAGVKHNWVPGITALLRETMSFAVDDVLAETPAVSVADAYGEVGVEFAVNTWLATEDADAYRPAPRATDGPLMERLRQLRATMQ